MEQTNAKITIDVSRLNRPLATLYPRRANSFVARLLGIPEDCTTAIVRVFATSGNAFTDVPVLIGGDGIGMSYLGGECFPATGSARYEVHATDANGNPTALGEGRVYVSQFTSASESAEQGGDTETTEGEGNNE